MRGRNLLRAFKRAEAVTIFISLFIPFCSCYGEVLSLSKALEYTEKKCYEAEIGKLDLESSKESTNESFSLYYPKIDFSFRHIHLDNDPAFKFGWMDFPAGEQVFWEWDLTLNYTIWDFGRRKKVVESNKKEEEAIFFKVSSDVKIRQVEVTALYMNALTLRDQIEVLKQRKKFLEEHLKIAQNLYEQGIVTRNDVLRTEVALRSLEDQMRTLKSAEINVENNLKKAIGINIEEEITLIDPTKQNIKEEGESGLPQLSFSEEELKKRVLEQNEALKALQMKIDSLNEVYNLTKKDYYPYVVGALGHSYEQNRYTVYPHINKLYLGISLNVFDGGIRKSKISKARIEFEKAQREKAEVEKEIIVKGLEAYREYLDSLEEYKTAKLNVTSSYENLRIIEDQYKEGLLKTTDFLEAESLYAESRFKEIESLHKILVIQAKIVAIIGEDLKKYFN